MLISTLKINLLSIILILRDVLYFKLLVILMGLQNIIYINKHIYIYILFFRRKIIMKELYFRRMENRLNEIFLGKIYDEDIKGKNDYQIKWNSRAYTAYVINMIGSDKAPLSANYVTDGINDNGIDAIYDDKENQKLVFIQTKFSQNKSIDDGELNKFLNGVKRLMNLDFSNCNKRILDRKIEIESALLKFDRLF